METEGASLIETVRMAESQADDFRSDMISQIKKEMRAEDEQNAENVALESENTSKVKEYGGIVAVAATGILGIGAIMKLRK